MNIKRIFGALLTCLGIGGLIYAAVLFSSSGGGNGNFRALLIYAILGFTFFVSGIGLLKTIKDEA